MFYITRSRKKKYVVKYIEEIVDNVWHAHYIEFKIPTTNIELTGPNITMTTTTLNYDDFHKKFRPITKKEAIKYYDQILKLLESQ